MRFTKLALPLIGALSLTACGYILGEDDAAPEAESTLTGDGGDAGEAAETPASENGDPENGDAAAQSVEVSGEATPLEERVATIGLLNKRNNVSRDIEMRPGETVSEGPVIITLASCERTAPWEMPQETGAFVQLDVRERGEDEHTRVFSGWLFKESPSLNVVEHPIYDVWVKDCAMSFPGE
ncbi:MAG: DUF2155 domain-containing protein [Pseudomonadota bacterium]|nr:DUF2155 domain-containing protein [Pseudomonadota bacterium]